MIFYLIRKLITMKRHDVTISKANSAVTSYLRPQYASSSSYEWVTSQASLSNGMLKLLSFDSVYARRSGHQLALMATTQGIRSPSKASKSSCRMWCQRICPDWDCKQSRQKRCCAFRDPGSSGKGKLRSWHFPNGLTSCNGQKKGIDNRFTICVSLQLWWIPHCSKEFGLTVW